MQYKLIAVPEKIAAGQQSLLCFHVRLAMTGKRNWSCWELGLSHCSIGIIQHCHAFHGHQECCFLHMQDLLMSYVLAIGNHRFIITKQVYLSKTSWF